MQFWLKCSIVLCVAGLVTGCANPENQVVDEDHQYVNAVERGPLILPKGVKRPQGSDDFLLPDARAGGVVGERLDIQSPPQLWPMASGSRLDEKNTINKIWFDKTNVVDNLHNFTFDALKSYLDTYQVEGSELNFESKSAKTGWIHHVKEGGFWLWGDAQETVSYRYETKQAVTPSGLITTVDVKLIGYRADGEDIALSSMAQEQINRAEITFLNDYVFHYQLLQEDLMRQAKIARAQDFTLSVGQYEQDQWAFHSAKDVETVWVSFRTLLENASFNVDDLDRTSKKLYVTYELPEQGFWSSLWSDDEAIDLKLAPGQYVIQVIPTRGRQSDIVILDSNEQPLGEQQYRNMESALTKLGRKLDVQL